MRVPHGACVAVVDVAESVAEAGVVAGDGVGAAGGAVAGGDGAGVGHVVVVAVVGGDVVVAVVADVWRLSFVGAPDGLRSPLATRFLYRLSPFPY